jgi:hypothetical protein
MNGAEEFTSMGKKSFRWEDLPSGTYQRKGSELVRIDDGSKIAADVAADNLSAALQKLLDDTV